MTLQDYLAYFKGVIPPTEALFRLIPHDKLNWKPVERSLTTGQVMTHMAEAIHVYGNGIVTGVWGFTSVREVLVRNHSTKALTVDEAVILLHTNFDEFTRKLRGLSDLEFDTGMVDTPQLGRVPRWQIAMFGLEHHLNHKAQLFMHLKILGVTVHTGTLYRG